MSKTAEQTLYVEGMHCAACESILEQRFKEKGWVKYAKASLSDNQLNLRVSDTGAINTSQLDKEFSDLGYSFHTTPQVNKSDTMTRAILIVALTAALFYINEKSGFLAKYSVTGTSGYLSYFVFGLAAGASSCAALVGGILLSLSKTWGGIYSGGEKHVPFTLFNAGRLISFAIMGGILGLVGTMFTYNVTATSIFTIAISALVALMGLQMLDIKWLQKYRIKPPKFFTEYTADQKNFKGRYMPLVIGAATFFLPCGFTIVAQTNALASGSFVTSSLMLLSFALGTLPMLALVSFSSVKLFSNHKFSQLFSYTAGILVFFFSMYTINSQLNVLGAPSLTSLLADTTKDESTRIVTQAGDVQILEMYAKGFEYFPKYSELEAGKPARIKFYNQGAYGCAASIVARGLFDGSIHIKEGYNEFDINTDKPGTYKLTCSMGMVPPVTIVIK
ncbi:hypothetical protein A3K01_04050 [candidate division WWE3 bacterium RIFOXYD1_FULL_43_17]|uniref:Urease accessory protein UreH-like transmembrane domain-containing protein n=3 Tax=Katanobacteria TaxID=422282 RepID=A0A1F4XE09_UNCKA|nr:MAG: hypothetical protein UU59_C0028G0008 [candidate division WWE3 bacterium GW2011_GWE1_41_27]KKS60057.1 MAG: hypothetical protein UV26_C0010G0010 [candidate division WWE3 bacterium GW2011_GWF2_42_42]OGC79870.1 MAG: hypothetical protein A3K01_04050 [candidate division WWE3 bacterium RIFOXYD1_FULL_43_17]